MELTIFQSLYGYLAAESHQDWESGFKVQTLPKEMPKK
jgi:hypothetical protein